MILCSSYSSAQHRLLLFLILFFLTKCLHKNVLLRHEENTQSMLRRWPCSIRSSPPEIKRASAIEHIMNHARKHDNLKANTPKHDRGLCPEKKTSKKMDRFLLKANNMTLNYFIQGNPNYYTNIHSLLPTFKSTQA